MNKQLKQILTASAAIAGTFIPGVSLVITGIQALADHDDKNNMVAIDNITTGFVQALENLKAEDIVDEVSLVAGINDLKSAIAKIKTGLKH